MSPVSPVSPAFAAACRCEAPAPCAAPPRRRGAGRGRIVDVKDVAGRDRGGDRDDAVDGAGDVDVDVDGGDVDVLDQPLTKTVRRRDPPARDHRPVDERYTPQPLGCDVFGCDDAAPVFVARVGVAGGVGGSSVEGAAVDVVVPVVPVVAAASVGPDAGLRVGVDVVGSGGGGASGGVFVGPRLALVPVDGVRVDAGVGVGLGGSVSTFGDGVVGPGAVVPVSIAFRVGDGIDLVVGGVVGAWPTRRRHSVDGGAPLCPTPGAPTAVATTTEDGTALWGGVTVGISTDVLLP